MSRRGVDLYVWKFRRAMAQKALVIFWLICLFLWWWSPPQMALGFSQIVTAAQNSSATTTASMTVASGSTLVILSAGATGSDAVTSIAQSSGSNAYFSRPQGISNSSPGIETWRADNVTGFTATITVNWSASGDHAIAVVEYTGANVRCGVASLTTGSAANASATLTPSDAVNAWYVGLFVYNNTNAYMAGTGNLRGSQNGAAISIAVVDATGTTVSVTHATGAFRVAMVELIPDAIEGGNVWTSGGTETIAQYWTGFRAGVSFTTGGNGAGYRACVIKAIYDGIGGGESVRAAIYSNEADPNKVRRADSGAVGMGTNAGTNTRNMVAAPLSFTMAASTTYWPTMNSNTGGTNWQDGTTAVRFTVETFASGPPDPWGNPDAASPDATGGYFWAVYQAISAAQTPYQPWQARGPVLAQ